MNDELCELSVFKLAKDLDPETDPELELLDLELDDLLLLEDFDLDDFDSDLDLDELEFDLDLDELDFDLDLDESESEPLEIFPDLGRLNCLRNLKFIPGIPYRVLKYCFWASRDPALLAARIISLANSGVGMSDVKCFSTYFESLKSL